MPERKQQLRRGGLLAAAVGVGLAAGLAAERFLVGRERRRSDPSAGEQLGKLRGKPVGPVASFDGTLLHAEETGAGPPIVLVHGFSLNLTSWHFQMRDLSREFRLIAYDHRGHGRSGKPPGADPDWSLDALARDLYAVIEETSPDIPVSLVGHSMGGMAVLRFCEMFPDMVGARVSALVLVDTTAADVMGGFLPGVPRRAKAGLQMLQEAILPALADRGEDIDRLRTRSNDLSYLATRLMGFGPKPSPTVVAFVEHMLARTPADTWIHLLPTLTGIDVSRTLDAIGVPVLVMVGTHDRLTPTGAAERIARAIRGAQLEAIRGAGHMPMLERPAEFNAALRAFLARAGARLLTTR
jgi:pimeloyl-ACP methyl ester carboxylesterase